MKKNTLVASCPLAIACCLTNALAVTVITETRVDSEGVFSFNTVAPEFTLRSGNLLAGRDVTLDTAVRGDHNTQSITSSSVIQIKGVTLNGGGWNNDPDNFFWKGKAAALTDGNPLLGATEENDAPAGAGNIFAPANPDNITYSITIDLGGVYDIGEIAAYARHEGGRQDQQYSIYTASSMAGAFTLLAGSAVDYNADTSLPNWGSRYATTMTRITDGDGTLETGVGAIRFVVDNPGAAGFDVTYFSELQVFAVPEPSVLGLAGLGLGAMCIRRRRH